MRLLQHRAFRPEGCFRRLPSCRRYTCMADAVEENLIYTVKVTVTALKEPLDVVKVMVPL
jgi:hypothetical protein